MTTGRAAVLVLLSLAFSGCLRGDGVAFEPNELVVEGTSASAAVSATRGGIVGHVVDSALYPLPGVNVSLENAMTSGPAIANTTTGSDGRFAFSLIEPGTYRLVATRSDYGQGAVLVQVAAGEIAQVGMLIQELPSKQPYLELFIRRGLLRCALAYGYSAGSCGVTEVMGPSRHQLSFNASQGHQHIVVETTWAKPSVTMDHDFWVRIDQSAPWTLVGRGFGVPVLRVDFWPGKEYETGVVAAKTKFPAAEDAFVFRVDTYYDGQYQREINAAAAPVCRYFTLGYCTGLGLEIDFTFDQFVSVFMHEVPFGVEHYTAVPDT